MPTRQCCLPHESLPYGCQIYGSPCFTNSQNIICGEGYDAERKNNPNLHFHSSYLVSMTPNYFKIVQL